MRGTRLRLREAQSLELVIDGTAILRAGRDGPYELGGRPKFSLTLDGYTTAPYRAEQFE